MAAHDQFAGLGGLRAIVMAASGAFAVDKSRGRQVIEPAIDLLASGKALMVFPEARINPTGCYSDWKRGVGWISLGAWKRINKEKRIALIPMHLCYGRRDPDSAGGGYGKMGLRWRAGATVTVGKPIYLDEIEDPTAEKITQIIKDWTIAQACKTAPSATCQDE